MKTSNIGLVIYGLLLTITLSSCGETSLPVETQLPPIPTKTQIPNPCASEDISEFIIAIDDVAKQFEDVTRRAEAPPLKV